MAKITNAAAGPRGVELADGTTHYVEPGQTVDLDVAKGHKLYEGLSEGSGIADLNKAELREHMDGRGIAYETDDNKADLLRKIEEASASE